MQIQGRQETTELEAAPLTKIQQTGIYLRYQGFNLALDHFVKVAADDLLMLAHACLF